MIRVLAAGGGTWMNGSFDPELNLIYWGVGNPNPDYYGDARPGDNLYSNRWSRWMRIQATCAGTISSRPMTLTIGIQIICRFWLK